MPEFDHDLPHFTPTTASIIAASWTARRDQTDLEPIRQHWRENPARSSFDTTCPSHADKVD